MRKITYFLALLLAFCGVTASAQSVLQISDAPTTSGWAENTHWYYIQNGFTDDYHSTQGYWSTNSAYIYESTGGLTTINETKPTDDYGLWCVVGDDTNGYKFYNKGEGTTKVLGITGSEENAWMKMYEDNTTTDGVTYLFDKATSNTVSGCYCFMLHDSTNDWLNNRDKGGACHFGKWQDAKSGPSDKGSSIKFTAAENVNVTYNYLINGTKYTSVTVETEINATPSAPTVAFVTNGALSKTDAITEECEIDVTCTENLPFTAQSTFDASSATWYVVALRICDGKYYWNASDDAINCPAYTSEHCYDVMPESTQWAFVGDLLNGFKIYNKVAGAEKSVAISDGKAVLSAEGQSFKLYTTNYTSIANGFCLSADGTNYINLQNNLPKTWTGKDQGSTVTVYAPNDAVEANINEFVAKVNSLINFEKARPANALGAYDMTTIQTLIDNKNYVEAETEYSKATSRSMETITAGYYRLVNGKDKKYLTPYSSADGILAHAEATPKAVNNVFYVKASDTEGQFVLLANSKAVSSCNTKTTDWGVAFTMVDETATNAGKFAFEPIAFNGAYNIAEMTSTISGNRNYCHENSGNLVGWTKAGNSFDEASSWFIVPATEAEISLNPVDTASYASAYLPFAATVTGAKAYTGELNAEGNELNLAEVATIPAGVGVILKGEADATTATLTISNEAVTGTSALEGTYFPVALSDDNRDNYRVLGNYEGVVGLYAPSEAITSLAANKAFLNVSNAAQAIAFNFNGDVTSINSAKVNGSVLAPVFDLSGRRVANPVKGGIYIQNGKKFVK